MPYYVVYVENDGTQHWSEELSQDEAIRFAKVHEKNVYIGKKLDGFRILIDPHTWDETIFVGESPP